MLDLNKLKNEFISFGYDFPEHASTERLGISVVNETNASSFLENMSPYKISEEELAIELRRRISPETTWWDIADLCPIIFVDFDNKILSAFYSEGTPMERYVPDGWTGEYFNFIDKCSKTIFPDEHKFWIQNGTDLFQYFLKKL